MAEAEKVRAARKILPTDELMGQAAARDVGRVLRRLTAEEGKPVMANFAGAPSQDTFLAALCAEEGIAWERVQAVHLDEYFDLPPGHPNTVGLYLREHLFDRVPIPEGNVHYVKDVAGEDPAGLAKAYGSVLREVLASVRSGGGEYVACIGIGVNGHIAYNEPHVDKRAGEMVLPVGIEDVSVQQQYDDYKHHPDPAARHGSLSEVPRRAVTVSCAGILAADRIFCMVPGRHKAEAVRAMWDGPVTDALPASLLRTHRRMTLYLDEASASLLDRGPVLVV